jgi:hypothetical protein
MSCEERVVCEGAEGAAMKVNIHSPAFYSMGYGMKIASNIGVDTPKAPHPFLADGYC